MRLKKIMAVVLTAAIMVNTGMVAGNQTAAAAVSGTITLSGSTSVSPLAQQLAKQYVKKNRSVKINFTNITGSGSGISDAKDGKVDIGMSSRALKEDEAKVLTAHVICNDGIAVVVNKSNPVSDISPQQLFDIFAKKTTNWKSISSSFDMTVAAYGREAGSGTRSCFEDVLKNDYSLDISKNYGTLDAEISSTGAMQTSIKTNKGAIGYMSLGDLDTSVVKAVKFNGVEASKENVANGTYKMSRPFVLATKGEPNAQTADFIKWCQTDADAQQIIDKMGFVTLGTSSIPVRQIKVSKKKINLKKKGTYKIACTVYPENASNKKVTFASSNKKVAVVTSTGTVTAKKAGKAVITVSSADKKAKTTVTVVVKK